MDISSQKIDLRSDTVTLPSPDMLKAIAETDLGDDVFSEDPTVNALEEKASSIAGKEAALIVPSGTMGNLVSILVQCSRGDEVILGHQAHTFLYDFEQIVIDYEHVNMFIYLFSYYLFSGSSIH